MPMNSLFREDIKGSQHNRVTISPNDNALSLSFQSISNEKETQGAATFLEGWWKETGRGRQSRACRQQEQFQQIRGQPSCSLHPSNSLRSKSVAETDRYSKHTRIQYGDRPQFWRGHIHKVSCFSLVWYHLCGVRIGTDCGLNTGISVCRSLQVLAITDHWLSRHRTQVPGQQHTLWRGGVTVLVGGWRWLEQ